MKDNESACNTMVPSRLLVGRDIVPAPALLKRRFGFRSVAVLFLANFLSAQAVPCQHDAGIVNRYRFNPCFGVLDRLEAFPLHKFASVTHALELHTLWVVLWVIGPSLDVDQLRNLEGSMAPAGIDQGHQLNVRSFDVAHVT